MQLARNLRVECVSRLRLAAASRVTPDQTIAEVVESMRQVRVGCVLVCQQEKLVGLFTERDLLRRVLAVGTPLNRKVGEHMTTSLVVVRPTEPIAAALKRMEVGGYRHLPVIDELDHPLGILSVKRIVHYLVDHFPGTIYNQPPAPNIFPQKPEGA
jgi:signal-transduction protein with cAMP-binding, CBS, and nucleotidyltransferase domain